ncbi:hypothetical protein CCH79_00020815, partial [Gambusia affinis]
MAMLTLNIPSTDRSFTPVTRLAFPATLESRYFAQILEEHGPLVDEDRLLVGELANFPAEARRKIAEAGGLESFLLESLRFIKIGRRIGLTRHAVGPRPAASLDDLDDIVDPRLDAASPDPYILGDFSDYLSGFCFPVAGPQPVLPNPYSFYPAGSDAAPAWSDIDCGFIANGYAEPHLDTLDDIYEQLERDPAPQRSVLSSEASRCRSDAAVQVKAAAGPAVPQRTSAGAVSSVAVNTERHERWEAQQLLQSWCHSSWLMTSDPAVSVQSINNIQRQKPVINICRYGRVLEPLGMLGDVGRNSIAAPPHKSVCVLFLVSDHLQGDIIRQERSNRKLQQQILKTQNGDKVDQGEHDDVRLMEKEVKEITTNIQ